ncbi:HEAT repeat domain-containing protein [Oleiagrimonas citrea]|uniref:HEAT repeat domain-containing protein n=1 Tax=Oleiagrimonas citrea TaxID=1665687 RepID=A0A846ZNM6_9GAMM|nr:HEAT repeat domain-containing protein [Oleiagrimonas citrea]NKZ39452.1 HEAT repeat domain-containing protein [Oleiagrimonas citrea]
MIGMLSALLLSGILAHPQRLCRDVRSCEQLCAPPSTLARVDAGSVILEDQLDHAAAFARNRTIECLWHLGRLGERARSAQVRVAAYLEVQGWPLRVVAAWALGRMHADGQVVALRARLHDNEWQVVAQAVHSLVLLQDSSSISSLRKLSEEHWYPAIRTLASRGIRAIRSGRPHALDAYFMSTPNRPVRDQYISPDENPFAHWFPWQAATGTEPPDWFCEPTSENQRSIGRNSVSWSGGRLMGANRGEFVGALYWLKHGKKHRLASGNVVHIQSIDARRAWVLTGYAHLGMQSGALLEVDMTPYGKPHIRKLFNLPGDPIVLRTSSDGITVHTSTVNVRVEPAMERNGFIIRRVACSNPRKSTQ